MKAPSSGGSATSDDEFLTPEQKVQDKWVKERIGQTLKDFESEMQANQARGMNYCFRVILLVLLYLKPFPIQPKKKNDENRRRRRRVLRRRRRPTTWT